MKRRQYGFTLVEMIVVIILIGILSAVALPKFMDFSGKAQRAAVEAFEGALGSGVTFQYSTNLLNGAQFFPDPRAPGNSYDPVANMRYLSGTGANATANATAGPGLASTTTNPSNGWNPASCASFANSMISASSSQVGLNIAANPQGIVVAGSSVGGVNDTATAAAGQTLVAITTAASMGTITMVTPTTMPTPVGNMCYYFYKSGTNLGGAVAGSPQTVYGVAYDSSTGGTTSFQFTH